MKAEPKVLAAVSIVWGLLVAIAAYGVMRGAQAILSPGSRGHDPAGVVWSLHAGFFWRAWTVSYAGGMAAFVTFFLARGNVERAARALAPAVVVATAILVLQSVFFP